MECTSPTFDGMVALIEPTESWVAQWQRINKFVKGLYAIRVHGRLPEYAIETLESHGIAYRPRDGTEDD